MLKTQTKLVLTSLLPPHIFAATLRDESQTGKSGTTLHKR